MMRRSAVVVATAVVGITALTGCAAPGSARPSSETSTSASTDKVVHPGEEWIAYQWGSPCALAPSESDTICLVRPDGTGRHELKLPQGGVALHPDWSPDGSQLSFVLNGTIWIEGVDGTGGNRIANCSTNCLGLDFPAWSPDGTKIAYTRYLGPALGDGDNAPPGMSTIETVSVSGGQPTVLVQTAPGEVADQARWSHDGSRLAMQLERFTEAGAETGAAIGVVSSAGGTPVPITSFDSFATYPDWNPITDQLVFVSNDVNPNGGEVTLQLVKPDGSGRATLGYAGFESQQSKQPSWTPDGMQVVFVQWQSRVASLVTPGDPAVTSLTSFSVSHPRYRPLP